jgi:MFS family permease
MITTTIPPLIKRNTALFALSQSFTGAGMQFAYGLGPLMVIALTDNTILAGLSVGLLGFSRFFVSYPVGKITDTYGRKPGIQFGLVLALCGALLVGASMGFRSAPLLVAGMLIFAMGMSAAQQLRVAATDMFPAHLRAQALGYVALGSLVGLVISPLVIGAGEAAAPRLGYDPLGLPWLLLPVLILPGMILIHFVRPDPKEIGMNLDRYYPGYAKAQSTGGEATAFSAWRLLRRGTTLLAIVCNSAAQGNMSIIMVLTSLVLHHHGHSLADIAISHVFHSAGMFAFTIPLGRLADRVGRVQVMLPGVAVTLIGAGFVTFTEGYWLVTLGTFLVGLGWAAANVSATALIADHSETAVRGRAIGLSESCAGATSVATALVTGPLIQWYGLTAAGLTALLVALLPVLVLPVLLAERRAGRAG